MPRKRFESSAESEHIGPTATLPGVSSALLSLLHTVVPLQPMLSPSVSVSAPVRASLSELTVAATLGEESALEITGEVMVFASGGIFVDLGLGELTVGTVTLDGQPAGVLSDGDGRLKLFATLPAGRYPLRITGTMVTPTDALSLSMPQTPLSVQVPSGLDVSVESGMALPGAQIAVLPVGRLAMTWKPTAPPPVRPRRLIAESVLGLSASEVGIAGHGEVRWRVLDGAVSEVTVDLGGPVSGLTVSGAVVDHHTLRGDQLVVRLREPQLCLRGRLRQPRRCPAGAAG